MAKLTKGEVQGIRLIADVFVFNDLVNNVFAKDEELKSHADALKQHVNKSCPKFELAQKELQKQIKAVREVWLNELTKK
ncbi:hypothetical protein [Vibrio parahaemolyticus]|uniref:hypothetical protein n=1 Tax=Vibrio parahaemolyticus TaxID=670 RepID=UPI003D818D54